MGITVLKKDKQLINLSKEDFIIKESMMNMNSTIMNLISLRVGYYMHDEQPDLNIYNKLFLNNQQILHKPNTALISHIREHSESYIATLLTDVLTVYLNNLIKHVAKIKLYVDNILEDFEELVELAKTNKANGDDRLSKVLYIFNNIMFTMYDYNAQHMKGIKEQTMENIIKEDYTPDSEKPEEVKTRYLVPYCLAVRSTILRLKCEFGIRSELLQIKEKFGYTPFDVTEDHMLYNYLMGVYDVCVDFQDRKILELVYQSTDNISGVEKVYVYRTLDKQFRIVFQN